MGKILDIENLSVSFTSDGVERTVVKDVSYSVYRGKTLGIVGESGSGKSVSSMAILQLLPQKNCRITDGHINFYISEKESIDLLSLDRGQMEMYRGKHIDMIFQEPMTSLNPVHKCGEQVMEMIRSEHNASEIPIIFLTGKSDKESVMTVMQLKPQGYLLKTMSKEQIMESIDHFFETRKWKNAV